MGCEKSKLKKKTSFTQGTKDLPVKRGRIGAPVGWNTWHKGLVGLFGGGEEEGR